MLSSGNSSNRAGAAPSSDLPPLPKCLPLDPITLNNQKYTRSGELRRVLGVPLGSTSEDHSFGVAYPKPIPPVATEELKHIQESVRDDTREARGLVKNLCERIYILDKYETIGSKKRQRSDMSSSERSGGVNVAKMGSQINKLSHDVATQRLEERTKKSIVLNKRSRTSLKDVRVDNRASTSSRNQILTEKDSDILPAVGGSSLRAEEKIRKLSGGGEGWETKMKRKRTVAAVRVLNGDRDVKRAMQQKLSADSKLRSCESQGFRSNSSPRVGGIMKPDASFERASSYGSTPLRNEVEGIPLSRDHTASLEQQRVVSKANNKSNFQDGNATNNSSKMVKRKLPRAPRTGSIMVLDSSSKVQPSTEAFQGREQLTSVTKLPEFGVANNQKRAMTSGSSSHAMAQWVGQRRHKNSRSRRANLVSPVLNQNETQISSQDFTTSASVARASFGTGGSLPASVDNITPKYKRDPENFSSPFGLSDSEESGAEVNKLKDNGLDGGEVTASFKRGAYVSPTRKNRMLSDGSGESVRKKGRTGNGLSMTRPEIHRAMLKSDNRTTTKSFQKTLSASDKSKSKSGRPPAKKVNVRKASTRLGPVVNTPSDFTGESDDDREELFAAATSARKASNLSCSGSFWKTIDPLFAPISPENRSYLKQQLNFAEELEESLSQQTTGAGFNILGGDTQKEGPECSAGVNLSECNGKSAKTAGIHERFKGKRSKGPLYQKVLSAIIEEGECEEFYQHSEVKNMYSTDDSHYSSCSRIEPKDRDRMDSKIESIAGLHNQKNCLSDRSIGSDSFRNPSMSISVHRDRPWVEDDELSQLDVEAVSEMCSNDIVQMQPRELDKTGHSLSDYQYQLMSVDDRLMLELQSIGLYPEALPDLEDAEKVLELKGELYQETSKKKKSLGKIDKGVTEGTEMEKKNLEHVAMDQLLEIACQKRLACRGSKVRKVSRQGALGFIKRTNARCRKLEETGVSCFSEPEFQDVLFLTPQTVECNGSGTASNTCNEAPNHQAEPRTSGGVSSSKTTEALTDDVVGSASSRDTSKLKENGPGGARGKRSEKDTEQTKDCPKNTSMSGAKSETKTKPKPKQESSHLSTQPGGQSGAGSSRNKIEPTITEPEELEDPIDFDKLPLHDFVSMGNLGVSNDMDGNQDLGNWLNFDEDNLLENDDCIGLQIPMDDLSDLNMIIN